MSHDQRIRSAVSSTSPSASSRFLPTSIDMQRAELHLALADQVGRPAQDRDALLPRRRGPGRERRARGGDRVLDVLRACPCANVPTTEPSIGERFSNVPSPSRSAPPMKFRWWPAEPLARASARPASNCAWSSSLSLRSVA